MPCSQKPGHPRYRNGDPEDQLFARGERLFRRYRTEHFQNGQLLPSAFRFPRQSFNREKYSTAEHVLHPDCCDGQELMGGWGVLECSATDLPTPIDADSGSEFCFEAVHNPLECCYAHTEIWCKRDSTVVDKPSPKVKETFRVKLAQRMTVRIPASNSSRKGIAKPSWNRHFGCDRREQPGGSAQGRIKSARRCFPPAARCARIISDWARTTLPTSRSRLMCRAAPAPIAAYSVRWAATLSAVPACTISIWR